MEPDFFRGRAGQLSFLLDVSFSRDPRKSGSMLVSWEGKLLMDETTILHEMKLWDDSSPL